MGLIKNIFHKLAIGFNRLFSESLDYVSENKQMGNYAEDVVFEKLNELLPDANIYRNICLNYETAQGEIDYLIIYKNKVFLIELKSWRGEIYIKDEKYYQKKYSNSGEIYIKEVPDPFKQINRNIYQIKQQYKSIWFEPVVLFHGTKSVEFKSIVECFLNIDELASYIKTKDIRQNRDQDIKYLKNTIKCYDIIESSLFSKKQSCIICESSLSFFVDGKRIEKKDIESIKFEHHFSYDDVYIITKGGTVTTKVEEKEIYFIDNNEKKSVGTSKIDYIKIG